MFLSRVAARIFRYCLIVTAVFVVLTSLSVLALRWVNPPTSAFIVLSAAHHDIKQPTWESLDNISPWLAVAVIAAEDQKFPHHWGFDFSQIKQALIERIRDDRIRGASTITQQLAKNLFLWSERSWVRKGLEAYITLLLEALLTKRRILELYLNLAEFGPYIFGAGAAASLYYAKSARAITLQEASMLAAALPSPRSSTLTQPSTSLLSSAKHIRHQIAALGGKDYLRKL